MTPIARRISCRQRSSGRGSGVSRSPEPWHRAFQLRRSGPSGGTARRPSRIRPLPQTVRRICPGSVRPIIRARIGIRRRVWVGCRIRIVSSCKMTPLDEIGYVRGGKEHFRGIGSAWLQPSRTCPPLRQSGSGPASRAAWPLDPTSDNIDNRWLIASGRRRTLPEKPLLERARTAEEARLKEARENRVPRKTMGTISERDGRSVLIR